LPNVLEIIHANLITIAVSSLDKRTKREYTNLQQTRHTVGVAASGLVPAPAAGSYSRVSFLARHEFSVTMADRFVLAA
jgi:hypothetical protein